MTRSEALAVLGAEVTRAKQQAANPYNHTCKELHVRKVFEEVAGRLEAVLAALTKGGRDARRTSRAA